MRTFSGVVAALVVAVAAGAALAADGVKYASPQAAFEQGLGAYKSGYFEIAVPALEEAAAKGPELNRFFAEFYLARIYADNTGALTSHAKAYQHYLNIALKEVDPDDGQRAPFVAKALIALAGYVRRGLPEIGLRPDPERSVEFLVSAANEFIDKDAQFELAKVYIGGSRDDVRRGVHYLSTLSEDGYAGAQALLADLYWRGKHVKKDEKRALALISVAVEKAPEHERIWIEDIYQHIFCGTTQGTRKQADGIVATWRKVFALPTAPVNGSVSGKGSNERGSNERQAELRPQRTCGNGEAVDIQHYEPAGATATAPQPTRPDMMQGGAAGFGLRDAGMTK